MTVRFGSSGATKAYRSVLSASGSSAISGASRWLEALAVSGATVRPVAAAATTASRTRFRMVDAPCHGLAIDRIRESIHRLHPHLLPAVTQEKVFWIRRAWPTEDRRRVAVAVICVSLASCG